MLLKQTDKKIVRLLCIIMALCFVFSSVSLSVYAVTDAEKAEYRNKINAIKDQIAENQKKIDELKAEAATYDDEINALQQKIGVLQEQIDLYNDEISLIDADIGVVEDQITGIENEIDALNKEIEELDKQVVVIQQQIADTYTLLGERIRASYMSGPTSSLEYLFSSDNLKFQEYLERLELLDRISQHDDELISDLQNNIESLKKKVAEIDDMKTQKSAKITELNGMKKDLESKKQDQVDARQVIQDSENEIQADLDKVMSVIAKLDASSAAYKKAIELGEDAISDYEDKLAAENTYTGSGSTGDMIWPLPYGNTYISSPFGMRTLDGSTRNHNGVDICRPPETTGATVVASKAGTVVTANKSGYGGGFGLYVVVNHGNGVLTYYCHLSAVKVNVGDYVTQGSKVGEAGNTGYSFGAHLHFAMMINGGWVNPVNYVDVPNGVVVREY